MMRFETWTRHKRSVEWASKFKYGVPALAYRPKVGGMMTGANLRR